MSKIIQINSVYATGSTGKIVKDLHKYLLTNDVESMVLYGRGSKADDDRAIKVSTEPEAKIHSLMARLSGVDFGYSPLATRRIIEIIREQKPDIVHLHCLNCHFVNAYKLISYLKKNHIKSVLTLHAEIMHTAGCEHAMNCEKWKSKCYQCTLIKGKISHFFRDDAQKCFELMKDAVSGFDELVIVGVSKWLTNRARQSAIFSDCKCTFKTIKNGLDVGIFYPHEREELRNKLNLGNNTVLLHVTSSFKHPIKGGKYILELAIRHPEWKIVIVGYDDNVNMPPNVVCISHTDNQDELAKYYSMTDLVILTSQRETFSMVCAESLCCGTPVVGFKAGGPETIAAPEYSTFVEQGNIEALERAIQDMLKKRLTVNSDYMHKLYDKNIMADAYYQLYKGMISNEI